MKLTPILSAGLAVMFTASVAFAQNATAPAPAAAAPAASSKSAKSVECSKEADAKGLHGKERKKFRAACKKGEDTGKM